jgi:hypothetical protein
MTDRTRQPAVLLRRIAKLEALLAAEKEISDRLNTAYRETVQRDDRTADLFEVRA